MSPPPSVREERIQEFWTKHPLIFGDYDAEAPPEEYFEDIERKMRAGLWYAQGPAEPLLSRFIDYPELKGKEVLEIGYGVGWLLAELLEAGAEVHGIDLSKSHYELCRYRFREEDIDLRVASAEDMPYPDDTFDFVAAWGVIHHASDDARCYREIHRVLKPGGRCFLMLYRKGGVKYYYQKIFKKGIVRGGLWKHRFDVDAFIRSVTDKYTDDSPGAPISRHYTRSDLYELLGHFRDVNLQIIGGKWELSDIPAGKLPISDWILSNRAREWLLRRLGAYWLVNAYK